MSTSRLIERFGGVAFLLIWAATAGHALVASGGITVLPPAPAAGEPITIRLANRFGAEARVLSQSIQRTGNTFVVSQDVDIFCTLPSNPVVASEFNVGALAPGTYDVVATIRFINSGPPGCNPPPIVQRASFHVAAAVPLTNALVLALLAMILGTCGAVVLTRQ